MGNGTKYTVKQQLLNAIKSLVKTNTKFLTTSDKIQTASNHIVESLWDRGAALETLTITDDNSIDYFTNQIIDGISLQVLTNIPSNIGYIYVTTTAPKLVFAVEFETTPVNGRKVSLLGNINLGQLEPNITYDGRLCRFLYNYTSGADTSNIISGSSAVTPSMHVDSFIEFMYWNGTWFYRGY